MASGGVGAVFRQINRLFGAGTVSGLTEGQLLSRFVQKGDEAAFEALVSRFGPMVLGVCRQLLGDPHAADDAFQATFLVLVRRAHAIRDRDLLGNWLYGVALKVAKRARADRARRRSREKEGDAVAADLVGDLGAASEPDLGPILHEELARLPEKYRAPIVLCFLDGRTHEEAAGLLDWPVGTVKGRVARAKDLLRERLSRRGVTASAALVASALAKTSEAAVPPLLLDQTVKAAMGIAAGGAAAAGLASAGAYALSEGVVTTMALTKMKCLAAGLAGLGLIATGATVYATQFGGGGFGGQEPPKSDGKTAEKQVIPNPVVTTTEPAVTEITPSTPARKDLLAEILMTEPKVGELPSAKNLVQQRVLAAKRRLDATAPFYENGTIAIDRYLDAARSLMEARIDAAEDDAGRMTAVEEDVRILRAILKREKSKYEVGVASLPNVAEAEFNLVEAEMNLAKLRGGKPVPAKGQPGGQVEEDADDLARNEKIREVLNKPIPFPFAHETPLEEVVKYLKDFTEGPGLPAGIPIYVDPVGLTQSDKTMASPITLNLEGVKARTGLRLLLKQLDLGYFIREGLLTITSTLSDDYKDATLPPGWREREAAEEERQMKLHGGKLPGSGGFR